MKTVPANVLKALGYKKLRGKPEWHLEEVVSYYSPEIHTVAQFGRNHNRNLEHVVRFAVSHEVQREAMWGNK